MDRLDFYENEELLQFLRVNKTAISLLEKPQTFLNQLRDHNMIPEDQYKKISRMKKKENVAKSLYELLEWVETKRKDHIALFWKCAFDHSIMNHYPILQMMNRSLKDGSFRETLLPEKLESDKSDQEQSQQASEGDERGTGGKMKKKQRGVEDGEQPGPSCPQTPAQRTKRRKISYSSPLKKGEENNIWEWAIYKTQLPVSCGDKEGTLSRNRLANGEKCIMANKRWFSPREFETFGGKAHYKNWKLSIRCRSTPLQKLIKEGHLKLKACKGGRRKAPKPSVTTDHLSTDSDEDTDWSDQDDERESSAASTAGSEEEAGREQEVAEGEETDPNPQLQISPGEVFKVTCGGLEGNLHMIRFASGTCGKSIRTKDCWLTPVEFLEKGLGLTDTLWKKDIECDGQPIKFLVESKIHTLLCSCDLCKPSPTDLKNQENDDECCLCKLKSGILVQCDGCPCSFHQKCHLPHVDDPLCQKPKEDCPWFCTFCVYQRTLEFYIHRELTMDGAKSSNMSQHLMECQYLFMRLRSADHLRTLAVIPTLAPPVSLGSVAERLQKQSHKTVGEFLVDVQRVFANSATYDQGNSERLNETIRLQKFFEEDFKKVFNISS